MLKPEQRALSLKMINRIRTTIEMGNVRSAEVQINEYIDLFGENSYIMLEKARYNRVLGNYEKAKEILEELIYEYPENMGYVIFELGKIYEHQKDYEKAIDTYKLIEKVNHKDKTYVYYSLGILCTNTYRYIEATKYLEMVIENSERLREMAKLQLAKIYRYQNNDKKSMEILDTIISKNDADLRCAVLYAKAKIYNKEKKYEKSKELVEEILIKYNPNYYPAIFEKIYISLKENQIEEAKRLYPMIENICYENVFFNIIKGDYHLKLNKLEEAKQYYQDVLNTRNKYHSIAYFSLGLICVMNAEFREAKKYYEKILSIKDEHYTRALIQLIQLEIFDNNYDKAFELYKKIDTRKIEEDCAKEYDKLTIIFSYKFGIPTVIKPSKIYGYNQVVNYNIEEAIKHIEYGHQKIERKYNTMFRDDIDIRKLIVDIQNELNNNNIVEIASAVKHLIHYPEIGYKGEVILNHLMVVREIHNNNIITMYPCNEYGSEIIEIVEKPKQKEIKRISQIDKFNQKYGLK